MEDFSEKTETKILLHTLITLYSYLNYILENHEIFKCRYEICRKSSRYYIKYISIVLFEVLHLNKYLSKIKSKENK